MDITINLTDDMKRAARYLGYTKKDIETEINRQCSDFFNRLIAQAKRKYVETKTMLDIDPEPLS